MQPLLLLLRQHLVLQCLYSIRSTVTDFSLPLLRKIEQKPSLSALPQFGLDFFLSHLKRPTNTHPRSFMIAPRWWVSSLSGPAAYSPCYERPLYPRSACQRSSTISIYFCTPARIFASDRGGRNFVRAKSAGQKVGCA